MNTEKIEKLKKSLSNSKIPADLKPKIEAEIKRLESLDAIATEKAKEEKEEEKEEAKPVAKTRKPRAKRTSTRKPSETSKPKRTAMSLAKEIRKEGETWKEAQERARKMMKEGSKEITKTVETELDKLSKLVRSKKELKSQVGRTNLLIDSKRKAKPMGKRISKDGNVYYENRANRTDRGTYGKYYLAEGGGVKPTLKKGDNVVVIGKRWFDRANGNTYHTAMVLVNGQSLGKSKMTYGYEEAYLQTAKEILLEHYNLPKGMKETSPLWQLREYGVTLTKTVSDGLKRDLATGGSVTNERKHVNKDEDYEVRYAKPRPSRKGYKGVRGFELGGVMTTDLAGHTGGGDGGLNAGMPLSGVSGTQYTGLVGETGAMSSGEMFMNGGGLPDGAEQSYVNYYLGEGASQGIYAKGGAIKNQYAGRTPEDVWDSLTETQRKHFLLDHYHFLDDAEEVEQIKIKSLDDEGKEYINNYSTKTWKKLSGDIRKAFTSHVKEGQYARGGGVRKVGNREYSYGRNWTNDHRHVNKGEDHEVKYTRKGKFLGVFNDGGFMSGGEGYAGQSVLLTNTKTPIRHRFIGKELVLQDKQPNGSWSAVVRKTGEKVPFDVYAEDFEQYAKGGALTNERLHVNHNEDYEVRYAKPRPSRKGYKGARKFMAGGSMETPRIYVADLEAYNNGRLVGEWLDLSDYNDADELMDAIQDVLKKSGGEEYAIHDAEYIPSSMYSEYMGKRDFEELYEMMDLADRNDLPLSVVSTVVSEYGADAVDEFYGKYDSADDFAQQMVDDLGIESFIDFERYLIISETDRRLLAQEMADSYVDDIRDEDGGNRLIEEAGMDVSEYEEADSETQEEMLDKAREVVYDEYYDTWYDGLNDPYYFLVEQQGMYDAESFANANFVQIDYEALAEALEYDYAFVYSDGDLYVFNIR